MKSKPCAKTWKERLLDCWGNLLGCPSMDPFLPQRNTSVQVSHCLSQVLLILALPCPIYLHPYMGASLIPLLSFYSAMNLAEETVTQSCSCKANSHIQSANRGEGHSVCTQNRLEWIGHLRVRPKTSASLGLSPNQMRSLSTHTHINTGTNYYYLWEFVVAERVTGTN